MSLVWRGLRRYRWYCLTALLFVLLEANCELLLPTLMARMIDEGVRTGELGRVLELGGWMAVAALAGILCVLVRNFCSGTASQRFGAELRRTLFAKCLRLTEGGVDQFGSGALVTRMSSDCDQLSRSVNSALRIGVKAPALCVGSVVYTMGLDMGLSWIVLAVVLGVTALITAYLAESGRRFRRVREAMDRVNTTVEEFLRGIRLIRALGREEWENRRFQASNGELEESGIRLQLLSAWFAPLVTLTVNLGIAAVLWAAGCGGAEAGTVSALVTYMTQMLTSLMTLIDVFKLLIRARTSVRRVEEVLALPEEGTLEGPEETGVEEPVLELRHVTFAYPGGSGVPALQDISFTLRRGERLAVVGPTGAGKTTLAWLCARLYEPQKGELYLGGRPMSRLPLGRVRRQVVVAAQRSALFSGTIRENLSMGDRGAGEAQLCAALETAQAADFVAEAGGLDAVLVQGGVNLSGGQRQRLSLARALVRGGAVLVLDDCTSALDPATERRVLDGLERRPGQAVLHITQKVRAARTADRILVLEEGRQVGLGTHRSLLDTCLSGPGRGGRRWHTVKRPAALCCLPSGGASSSASAPTPGPGTGGAPCGGSWPSTPAGAGSCCWWCALPCSPPGRPWRYPICWDGRWTAFCLGAAWSVPLCQCCCPLWQGPRRHSGSATGADAAGWRSSPSGWWPASGGSALPSWGGCPCPTLTATPMGIP